MAQISITIPDAVMPRVLDAFAIRYGWNSVSGKTKAQFARDRLIDHIKDVVKASEAGPAVANARDAAIASVDADITLT